MKTEKTKQYSVVLKGDDVDGMEKILSYYARTFSSMVRVWIKCELRCIASGLDIC